MKRPMADMDDDLCSYCADTDYGKTKSIHGPSGVSMCEGRFCPTAYEKYLESDEDTDEEDE
ncbi:MAG: hypothetical protein RR324_01160 [Cellulosilyticaceae bacterium]